MRVHFAWLEYLDAFRSVTRQYRRSFFGVGAVAFGVIALVLAAGFIEWIFWATREGTIQSGLGHIHVMRPGYLEHGASDPAPYVLPDSSPARRMIVELPDMHVTALAPRLAFNGLISRGDATISFLGEGVNPEAEREVSRVLVIAAGENLSTGDPNGILLGRGLAENLGVRIGDTVALLANTSSGGINGVECKVRGLFNTASKAYDDAALRVPMPVAQRLIRVAGSHRWILMLDDTAQTDRTLGLLKTRFRDSGLEFVPWYQLADFYNKVVALLSQQIHVVELIIAVIIVLSISNTMLMSVLERTAEIGTCMALGRNCGHMLRHFVYEGLTIGLLGGAFGLLLGFLLAHLISVVGIPMPPAPGMSQGYTGAILVTPRLAITAFLIAATTATVASVYPAWRASRLQIVDALRHMR